MALSRKRFGLVALVLVVGTLLALLRGWSEVYIQEDTPSYVDRSPVRTLAYPAFIAVFDRTPGVSGASLTVDGKVHEDPGHRLVNVVRAQKLVTVLSVAVLAWAFSEVLSPWLVLALLVLGALVDFVHEGGSSVHWNVTSVLSEGINHALVFVYLATLFSYLVRPSWRRGALFSATLAALELNRPANLPLLLGFFVLWLADRERLGWRDATRRAALLLALALVPLGTVCVANRIAHGHAKLHAISGLAYMCLALEVADESDVSALEDPGDRAFLRACVGDPARESPYTEKTGASCIIANLAIVSSAARTIPVPEGETREWFLDPILARTARTLVERHPRAYADLVLVNVRSLLVPWRHALLALTFAAALFLYLRSRRPELIFACFLAVVSLVSIAPACLCQFPFNRYRSQLLLTEFTAFPFLLATLLALGRAALEKRASPGAPEA